MMIRQTFLQCSATTQMMLIASFSFNLGFYMLIPFLARHLQQDLLLSATAIGLVLAIRSFSQQGLFFIGGTLADRFGIKSLILTGCILRALGFLLFAIANTLTGLIAAALLSGFAGALFTPAAQAYFSEQQDLPNERLFALVSVARSGGELLGPVLGVILLSVHFSFLCMVAALPFCIFAGLFACYLRSEHSQANSRLTSLFSHLQVAIRKPAFIVFCLIMMSYFVLINQLTFSLPIEMQRRGGGEYWLASLFVLSALLGIIAQLPVTHWCERHFPSSKTIALGMLIMGTAFVSLLVEPTFISHSTEIIAPLSVCLATALLTLGMLMVYPAMMARISIYSEHQSTATHFGVFYFFAGIGLTLGNVVIGFILDKETALPGSGNTVWLVLFFIAITAAASISLFSFDHNDISINKELAHD